MSTDDLRTRVLECLRDAKLSTVRYLDTDGYGSTAIRGNDEAAQVALDALTELGIVPAPADSTPREPVCCCTRFGDTGGMRIGDLACPVHGVRGSEPLDGPWGCSAQHAGVEGAGSRGMTQVPHSQRPVDAPVVPESASTPESPAAARTAPATHPHGLPDELHNGDIYAAVPGSDIQRIATLEDPYPELTQHIAGSRTYWGGVIHARNSSRDLIDTLFGTPASAWAVWNGVFMRIDGISHDPLRPGGRALALTCSQQHRIGYVEINGYPTSLELIEPSPPTPGEEWWPRERARVVRELIGDGRRPGEICAPNRRGELERFDPWAPEYLEEPHA